MKHLSFLFAIFLAATTPAQSAELSRLCEPYAWANMRVKKADGTLLLWEDLRADIKNDQKIAQSILKNKYSDADLQTAFNNAKKTVKARYDAQRYEVFSDVMAHILAPFTKRFGKNKGIEICMKMLSRESACAGENADLQKYLDGINGAFWFDEYRSPDAKNTVTSFFDDMHGEREKYYFKYSNYNKKIRELDIWEKAQKISQQDVDKLLKEGYNLQPHIKKLRAYDLIERQSHVPVDVVNGVKIPRWVQISNLWHDHKRDASPSTLQTEFNNLAIEAALPELLAPRAKNMLEEQNNQRTDVHNEVVASERDGKSLSIDPGYKEYIKGGLMSLGFKNACNEYIDAIYDAYQQGKSNNIWKKAQEIALNENYQYDQNAKERVAEVLKIQDPKLEERKPEEVFVERTKLPWYIYYPLYPFFRATVALQRRAPWFFTKAGILESNEEAAKQKSRINFDTEADKHSGAASRDVLATAFLKSYQEKLNKFNGNATTDINFFNQIKKAVHASPITTTTAQITESSFFPIHPVHEDQPTHKDFRICVNDFCVALDSFDKLIKDPEKTRQYNVSHWFNDYLEHKNKSDYRDWKSKSTITDRREYHLKALYNAHEDLAQAGRKLVDFWVENSEKVLKVSDNGASQRRPAEMRKALEDYGVAELILRRVFDADPKD